MRQTARRTVVNRAVAVCAAIGLAAAGTPASAQQPDPPALPAVTNGCLGPSPVLAGDGIPWPFARLTPDQVWPLTRGAGVLVAILDSGVSAAATGLSGAVLPGRDILNGGHARTDCLGRGTALAGIVAGRQRTGGTPSGVAPEAAVLPVRVIDAQHGPTAKALAAGIDAAVAAGADIVVLGAGDPTGSPDLRAAVTRASGADVLIVASVNDRTPTIAGQPSPAWFPAAYPEVLAVGGVDTAGRPTEQLTPDSGLDLLAPGVGAVVPGPQGPGVYTAGGPAVAAAYAAGVAALVRAYHPDLTAGQVRARLLATAERPPGATAGTVEAYAAVAALEPGAAVGNGWQQAMPVVVPVPPPPDGALARARVVTVAIVTLTLLVAAVVGIRGGRRRGGHHSRRPDRPVPSRLPDG